MLLLFIIITNFLTFAIMNYNHTSKILQIYKENVASEKKYLQLINQYKEHQEKYKSLITQYKTFCKKILS